MDVDNATLLCSRLKELRSSLGLTQKDFAEKINASAVSVSSYEIGAKTPSLEMLLNIATTFNVSLDWLCGLTNKLDKSISLTTYSELISLIMSIVNSKLLCAGISFIENPKLFDYFPSNETLPYIYINDLQIKTFFKEWTELTSLYEKGTIKESLYQLWLKDRLESLSIPISSSNRIDFEGLPFK